MNIPSTEGQPEIHPVGFTSPYTKQQLRLLGVIGLHCGSGQNLIPGFINTDIMMFSDSSGTQTKEGLISEIGKKLYYMPYDSTKTYPFEEGSFENVYSEHFIEHITPVDSLKWLREVRRLLMPGGIARISTPDLELFSAGYFDPKGTFNREFINRLNRMGMKIDLTRKAFVMNLIFREWGHRWLYDFNELKNLAVEAGFRPNMVKQYAFRQGESSKLSSLDLEIRNDHSLYVEITK